MTTSRTRQSVVVVLTLLVGVVTYLWLTEGMQRLGSSRPVTNPGVGAVPEFVHDPPNTVPTTADYGPVGPVSVVFAGREVLTGLHGEIENPWIAVSSESGAYRALSAPHLPDPAPGAVRVSADGTRLAWGYQGGVVLYDPLRDDAVQVSGPAGDEPVVGSFSPDGTLLVVHDGQAQLLDVPGGEFVATLSGVTAEAARHAAWTPDGTALTYVSGGAVVIHRWRDDERTVAPLPASLPEETQLAWRSDGRQLAVMRDVRGVRYVDLLEVAGDGSLQLTGTVRPDGYAQQRLLGFTGDARVTVTALTLESGPLPLVFNLSTEDAFPPTRVMQLPGTGHVVETVEIAADPLAEGSVAYDEPNWPASHLAKLVASLVVTVFLLGLYLTRRPRERLQVRRARGSVERREDEAAGSHAIEERAGQRR